MGHKQGKLVGTRTVGRLAPLALALVFGLAIGWAAGVSGLGRDERTELPALETDDSAAAAPPTALAGAPREHPSEEDERPALRIASVPDDAGAPTEQGRARLGECFVEAFEQDRELLAWTTTIQQRARRDCLSRSNIRYRDAPEDPRARCGALTEEQWVQSSHYFETALRAVRELSGQASGDLLGRMWANTDCTRLSDREFGAALQLTSLAPQWVHPDFIVCAIRSESHAEAFPL